jgi:uncharacterized OB-fold protein
MSFSSITPARFARYIPQRYRLEAGKCKKCGHLMFPPRIVCPGCKSRESEMVRLPDEGVLLSFTIVHTPAAAFTDEKPLAVGIVELAPGARITTQIVDTPFEKLAIGMKVKIEFRKVQTSGEEGLLAYGYKVVEK